jgi:hypothetical protein
LLEQVKEEIDAISMKLTKKNYLVDFEKLSDPAYRGDFRLKMRELGLAHL